MARLKLSECLARMIPEPDGEEWEFVGSFIANNRAFNRAVKDALRANGLSLDRPEEFRLCYDGCHEYALYRERSIGAANHIVGGNKKVGKPHEWPKPSEPYDWRRPIHDRHGKEGA